MSNELAFVAEWKALERGTPEERAGFSAFGISHGATWLTEAEDGFAHSLTSKVYVSAYLIAERIAWNWWRLRWEPRAQATDWSGAHSLAIIGHGYVWPNVTIFSDGERVALIAKPTLKRAEEPLCYIADCAAIVSAKAFETAVDLFMTQMRGRLDTLGITGSNFETTWREVLEERADPEMALRRKFEALLGADPDEGDATDIKQLVADAATLGQDSMGEIAADHSSHGAVLTAQVLNQIAESNGFAGSPRDAVQLLAGTRLPRRAELPAWRLGERAAKLLRQQERLELAPIPDSKLAEFAGLSPKALTSDQPSRELAFVFYTDGKDSRTVFRSKWHMGRRFELARLLGDLLMNPTANRLFPATRSHTFRQKAQRAFAAEFLAPFDEVTAMLDGDYSEESRQDVAAHFQVSELTIRTLLVNHGRLERDDLDAEFELAAA